MHIYIYVYLHAFINMYYTYIYTYTCTLHVCRFSMVVYVSIKKVCSYTYICMDLSENILMNKCMNNSCI